MDGCTVSPDMFSSTHCSGRWRLPAHLHPHTCARGLKCKCSTHFQQYSPQMNSAPASGLALAIAVLSQRGKAPLLGGKEPFFQRRAGAPIALSTTAGTLRGWHTTTPHPWNSSAQHSELSDSILSFRFCLPIFPRQDSQNEWRGVNSCMSPFVNGAHIRASNPRAFYAPGAEPPRCSKDSWKNLRAKDLATTTFAEML